MAKTEKINFTSKAGTPYVMEIEIHKTRNKVQMDMYRDKYQDQRNVWRMTTTVDQYEEIISKAIAVMTDGE
ncbi:MAG: hypothetical protein PHW63_08930 [Alphaproteobacteria bacterium]|nr:hypothetical protein [Alphaproteobacteria bacterium]